MFLLAALVLVPTRELCLQVYEILHKLLHRFHWIVPGYVMGGENRSKEKARLRKGEDFLHLFLFSLAWFDGSGIYGNVCMSSGLSRMNVWWKYPSSVVDGFVETH